ncbi:hypothetical protein QJS04_geneDACA019370 [Acorus gramineus]|uniref:AAA ATPase AAA+ lid domain-containing protein n=1 Tax=Acorus gramineus TaxID=55184 RepID=A0AAV9AUD3_ACOGR|nr:hypothetical protein QJS04_geneDACA019370 [Acorus gramineus]
MSRAIPKSNRKEFLQKIEQMFDQLTGPIVLICGQNKFETGPKERTPISLKRLTMGLKADKTSKENNIYKLFDNVICIHPPKEEEPLRTFNKQIEEDRIIVISRSNFMELQKVLDENELVCVDLLHVNTNGVVLTKQKAEQVVGWARNHYLSSCNLPSVKGDRLDVPRESLEVAIVRLMEKETVFKKPSHSLKSLAKDEYENNFVSVVVPPDEVGVRFNDIALQRGITVWAPWDSKTLLAKALATEAGANFISITGSILTSKVDSLLGAVEEPLSMRRLEAREMSLWQPGMDLDQKIANGFSFLALQIDHLTLMMPSYVVCQGGRNVKENINSDFKYDELANATEGYSGSDLKNLCIAAAYRPVQELLEEEQKGGTCGTSPILRPLKLDDFIQAKAKFLSYILASIAYDAASMNELRKWNEQYGEGGSRKRSPFGFGLLRLLLCSKIEERVLQEVKKEIPATYGR